MSRDLHPDYQNELIKAEIAPVVLVALDMQPEPVYLWTGLGNLQYDGKVFKGVGSLSNIEPIKESSSIKSAQVKLTLNCLKHVSSFADLRNQDFQGRLAEIHYGMLNTENGQLIAVEQGAFIGSMDSLGVRTTSNGSEINLILVNEMTTLKKSWGRYQTDSDHQADYQGDTSRRFIPAIQDLKIRV